MNTLCEIALNSFLIHFLATTIVTNESWTILEYAYLPQSREEAISWPNFSFLSAVYNDNDRRIRFVDDFNFIYFCFPQLLWTPYRLASRQRSRGQDASGASTDSTAQPEEDENQDIEALNLEIRPLRFYRRYKGKNRAHTCHSFDAYDLCDYY